MRFGNHASTRDNPDQSMQVFVTDAKRGFALVVDDRLLPFIRDTYLTPIGIVDLEKPWKNDRLVFDTNFQTESCEPILIDDNDTCGAFRLVYFNPEVVSIQGYRFAPNLGFATGQTSGDNVSAANFSLLLPTSKMDLPFGNIPRRSGCLLRPPHEVSHSSGQYSHVCVLIVSIPACSPQWRSQGTTLHAKLMPACSLISVTTSR
ncbi:hypothetical protein IV203_008333 [Nitzschia inconspicua]|uniref:Uncharacterized protein n=1 Tax=Nitzschia inconspicua TaxID=303405 RepID=A0A9K3PLV5_9STRA|nr:hypothetical protein IV203_008333 [Nitzschia inconspicua]